MLHQPQLHRQLAIDLQMIANIQKRKVLANTIKNYPTQIYALLGDHSSPDKKLQQIFCRTINGRIH